MHTAVVQASLKPGHRVGSYEYIARVKRRMREDMPELAAFFSSGSLVDAVVNMGMPAPIDLQVSGRNLQDDYKTALQISAKVRALPGVADVFIPQDLDYPALRLNIDRMRAGELGLSEKEVMSNVITALTSNQMVAPSIWVDPKNGNNYWLTVQYPEHQIRELRDLRAIPLHGVNIPQSTRLDMVSTITPFLAPTEVDHYQIRRRIDVYVRPLGEALGDVADQINRIVAGVTLPDNVDVVMQGTVQAMNASFRSFTVGLSLSVLLLYLILVAHIPFVCRSFYHLARPASRHLRRALDTRANRDDAQRDVVDGASDAGWNRHVEQHPDCRIRASSTGRRAECSRCHRHLVPRAAPSRIDDFSGDYHWTSTDGFKVGRRK